jgi:hypothetical protein
VFCRLDLGAHPEAKILLITYAQDLAENISRSIRAILQADWFKQLFQTRIAKGHGKVKHFGTVGGGKVYATSFDGSITGFGGDLIIVDDAHNVSDLEYPFRLKRTVEQFHSNVMGRLDNPKKGRVLVVGHRVHESDISASLLEAGGWTHLALPVIAIKTRTYTTNFGRWKRRKGKLLRPDAYDTGEIERLKRELVNSSFDLLYQRDADAQCLRSLTAEHFQTYERVELQNLPHFISVDPGTSDGEGRSFSVVQVWASNGVAFFLVEQFRQ